MIKQIGPNYAQDNALPSYSGLKRFVSDVYQWVHFATQIGWNAELQQTSSPSSSAILSRHIRNGEAYLAGTLVRVLSGRRVLIRRHVVNVRHVLSGVSRRRLVILLVHASRVVSVQNTPGNSVRLYPTLPQFQHQGPRCHWQAPTHSPRRA